MSSAQQLDALCSSAEPSIRYKVRVGVLRESESSRSIRALQQGNALYAIVTLGLADKRTEALVERLLHWQWPDGGWNCDKDPSADSSSFMETLTPMRGLAAFAQHSGDGKVQAAVARAASVDALSVLAAAGRS